LRRAASTGPMVAGAGELPRSPAADIHSLCTWRGRALSSSPTHVPFSPSSSSSVSRSGRGWHDGCPRDARRQTGQFAAHPPPPWPMLLFTGLSLENSTGGDPCAGEEQGSYPRKLRSCSLSYFLAANAGAEQRRRHECGASADSCRRLLFLFAFLLPTRTNDPYVSPTPCRHVGRPRAP
jgi:hypothetical protein